MSKCPKSKSVYNKKPNATKNMIKHNEIYVWEEIHKNPNLYCWIPKSIYPENTDTKNISKKDSNIQDIPPPPILYEGEDFEKIIENVSFLKNNKLKKLLKDKIDLISVDDPAKYPIVKKFIADKGLKLYGGAALNLYMPVKHRFYDKGAIPDYDMYSPTPWKHAVELANIMDKAGYEFTEAKGGIHPGTYKVFSNFWPIADITYMDPETFHKIETRKKQGMLVLSPNPLAMDMYKELSQPGGNLTRWGKVATRLELLKKFSNVGKLRSNQDCNMDKIFNNSINIPLYILKLLKTTDVFIKNKQLINIGPIAYNSLIESGGGNKKINVDHFEVLSDNAHSDIQELFTLLMKKNPSIKILTSHRPWRPLESISYYIHTDNGNLICQISQLTLCVPYIKIKGKFIASIDYQKFELYNDIVFEDFNDTKTSKCKLKYITDIQNKYYTDNNITEFDYSPFQRFIGKCKGPILDIPKHVYMARWIDRIKQSKKIRKLYPNKSELYLSSVKGKHIRIFPKPDIDSVCYDLDFTDCNYPCAWNKHDGKCENVSQFPYRPLKMI